MSSKTINTKKYIESALKIRTKDGKIAPFILNNAQLKLYNIIKKGDTKIR